MPEENKQEEMFFSRLWSLSRVLSPPNQAYLYINIIVPEPGHNQNSEVQRSMPTGDLMEYNKVSYYHTCTQ